VFVASIDDINVVFTYLFYFTCHSKYLFHCTCVSEICDLRVFLVSFVYGGYAICSVFVRFYMKISNDRVDFCTHTDTCYCALSSVRRVLLFVQVVETVD